MRAFAKQNFSLSRTQSENGQNQIIAFGAADYPPTAAEFNAGQLVVRAILGGTGKYMDAPGRLTSTRNAGGSYKQVFMLVK